MKRNNNYLIRYSIFIVGLFIMAFGVAFSTKAGLGTSPISCVPYILSLILPWTMGEITIAMHIVFILIQIAILRKDYDPIQLLQLPVAFLFGFFTDLTLAIVKGITISGYFMQWIFCVVSFFLVAFGVFCEVKADVVMLAGEGVVSAISKKYNFEFPKIKICFDSFLVLSGTTISLLSLHKLMGVREGTIAAAIMIGAIVKLYSKHIRLLDKLIEHSPSLRNS